MSGEAISPVDLAWLRMDRPTNPMVIVAVLILSKPLSLARLKRVLTARLLTFERFRDRPVCDALSGHWQRDEHFRLDAHLRRLQLPPRAGEKHLQAAASRLASTPLNRARPLWQFHLVEHFGHGSAIVGRVHHCYADGVALMRVLMSLTDPPPGDSLPGGSTTNDDESNHAAAGPSSLLTPVVNALGSAGTLAQRAIEATAAVLNTSMQTLAHPTQGATIAHRATDATRELAKIAMMAADPPTPLKGTLSRHKQVSWAEPLPFEQVKALAQALGVSINDVLLATVAGALGCYLESHAAVTDSMSLRALVPVNLRAPEQTPRLGNEFGLVFASLPVGERHPLSRLYAVHRDMAALKHSSQAVVAFWLLTAMGLLPGILEQEVIELFTTKASVVISNVPGPRQPLYVAGVRIERQFFWVPQAGSIGVGVSLLTYGGTVHFGVIADRHLIAHPEQITSHFAGELERLSVYAQTEMRSGTADPAATSP